MHADKWQPYTGGHDHDCGSGIATGSAAQTSLMVTVDVAHALPLATYYLIVRVNGAQAATAPEVVWVP